jgi:hypothetical protein
MKSLWLAVCLVISAPLVHAGATPQPRAITLTAADIASIKPARDTSREALEKRWGQFEVRIPKQRFAIPAPHCRRNIILRMPAVAPEDPAREQKIATRWQFFQRLVAVIDGHAASIDVPLDSGPYMKVDSKGGPVLEYCNVYVKATAVSRLQE